ncbi:MAG: aldehyde-activating protein [Alphaproteobacteria bacterium]|nr:aldehyde-activating protein [Alphaproteobacteria bacterium]
MGAMMAFGGGCHCGAISVTFESALPAASIERRACQCSFCRSHGGLTVSDADGALRFDADAGSLVRYRFGLKTADFLICARCGVYVGAIYGEGDEYWGIVNSNVLHDRNAFTAPVVAISYDNETPSLRGERRKQRWTPVEVLNF